MTKNTKANPETLIIAKGMDMPEGYIAHDGGPCPVEPERRVYLLVRTNNGVDEAGPIKAKLHEWPWSEHVGGWGEILGYRLEA
jgi:hypothetical protein